MGLTWNDINELIQQNPILQFAVDQIKSLGIEWLLSLYQKGKSRTVDEELVLCLKSALESFSKQFALEYDDTMALSLLDELKARENLNQNDWRNILESVTGLQFDEKELLGCAYNHQGFLYYFEYNDQLAEASYRKAYQIRKKLKSKKLLAQTESNLALLYQGMWKEEKDEQRKRRYLFAAEKYQKEALKVFESIFHGEEQSNLASAYNNMAAIKNSLCENEEAVFYYNKAASIRSHMKGISPGNLSVTYYGLSNTYYDMAESKKEGICYLHYLKMSLYYLEKAKDLRISEIRNGNQKWSIDNLETKEQILLNKIKDSHDFRKEMTKR